MLPVLELKKLKALETFDFYGLHDERLFNEWLKVNSEELGLHVYRFGNLKVFRNRRELYASIFNESEFDFPIQSRVNFENQISVFKRICTNFHEMKISELELIEQIASVWANCEWDVAEEFPIETMRAIWSLYDFSSVRPNDLAIYRTDLLRLSKVVIEIDVR